MISLIDETWRNGGKVIVAALIFAAFSLVVLASSGIFYYLSRDSAKPSLCEYDSPRQILTTVRGIEGPAAEQNGTVVERATRCVDGADLLDVRAFRSFVPIDPPGPPVRDLTGEPQIRTRGRNITDISVQLLSGVTPGRWRLEGVDIANNTGDIRVWHSEDFLVVERK